MWQQRLPRLIELGGRLAILGSGDAVLEGSLKEATVRYPGRVGIATTYDEPLSHLLQAGSDAILIPSRFEPCGLTQLYGLHYGCVPVVARVGGLADTIVDANDAALSAGAASGIQFAPVTQEALEHALQRASALYADKAGLGLTAAGRHESRCFMDTECCALCRPLPLPVESRLR